MQCGNFVFELLFYVKALIFTKLSLVRYKAVYDGHFVETHSLQEEKLYFYFFYVNALIFFKIKVVWHKAIYDGVLVVTYHRNECFLIIFSR